MTFAESMTIGDGTVPPSVFNSLRHCYSTEAIVEIVALVGIMQLACTLSAAFELNPD